LDVHGETEQNAVDQPFFDPGPHILDGEGGHGVILGGPKTGEQKKGDAFQNDDQGG